VRGRGPGQLQGVKKNNREGREDFSSEKKVAKLGSSKRKSGAGITGTK